VGAESYNAIHIYEWDFLCKSVSPNTHRIIVREQLKLIGWLGGLVACSELPIEGFPTSYDFQPMRTVEML
jgi:hypothetical protein